MSDHTYKIIELVGSSTTGTDDAIQNAIGRASKTLRHMDWFEVVETRGHLRSRGYHNPRHSRRYVCMFPQTA